MVNSGTKMQKRLDDEKKGRKQKMYTPLPGTAPSCDMALDNELDFQDQAVQHMIVRERAAQLNLPPGNGLPVSRIGILGNTRGSGKTTVVARLISSSLAMQSQTTPLQTRIGLINGSDCDPEWYAAIPQQSHFNLMHSTTMVLCPPYLTGHWAATLRASLSPRDQVTVLDQDTPPDIFARGGVVVVPATTWANLFVLTFLPPNVIGRLVIDEPEATLWVMPNLVNPALVRAGYMWILSPDSGGRAGLMDLCKKTPPQLQDIMLPLIICSDPSAYIVTTTFTPPSPQTFHTHFTGSYTSCGSLVDKGEALPPCPVCTRSCGKGGYPYIDEISNTTALPPRTRDRIVASLADGVECGVCGDCVVNGEEVPNVQAPKGCKGKRLVGIWKCCGGVTCSVCAQKCQQKCPFCRCIDRDNVLHVRNWTRGGGCSSLKNAVQTALKCISIAYHQGGGPVDNFGSIVPLRILLVAGDEPDYEGLRTMNSGDAAMPVVTVHDLGLSGVLRSRGHVCVLVSSAGDVRGLPVQWTHVISGIAHDSPEQKGMDLTSITRRGHYKDILQPPQPILIALTKIYAPCGSGPLPDTDPPMIGPSPPPTLSNIFLEIPLSPERTAFWGDVLL